MRRLLVLAALVSGPAVGRGQTVFAYDGFDTAAADNSVLTGQAGATSFGWQAGSSWQPNISWGGTDRVTHTTAGLALTGFGSAGGAVRVAPAVDSGVYGGSPNSNPGLASHGRPIAAARAGTYFGSHLFRHEGPVGTAAGTFVVLGGESDSSSRMAVGAKQIGQGTEVGGLNMRNASVIGTNAGDAAAAGTTHLTLFKVETGATTTLTGWVLTEAQYAAFVAAGRTEGYLNGGTPGAVGPVLQRLSVSRASDESLAAGEVVSLYGYNGQTTVFDEFRLGDSLGSVTPVPEPAALALAVAGLVVGRRRGRATA